MLETLNSCPFCNHSGISPYLETKDHSVSGEVFALTKCNNCGLIFTNPRPDKDSISKYYESTEYISHTNSKKGLFNSVYQLARKYSIYRKFLLIHKYSDPKSGVSLLDVGCGTGEFLSYCSQKGYQCVGIEPNPKARDLARTNYGLSVLNTPELAEFASNSFDFITMWHVLEHVHDLKPAIQNLARILNNGGYCFIAVPNPDSYDAKRYGTDWAAYDVPRHLFHFRPSTIKNIFSEMGFEFISSLPMKLDAYYVSLLSEKSKSDKKLGIPSILRSFKNGFNSNLKAANPEEYSSVIYIFRKRPA